VAYDSSKDEVLWEGEKKEYKPKATLHAAVKSYQGGQPKLMLIEQGEGYNGKEYSGMILKRQGIEDIDMVLQMLQDGKVELEKALEKWERKKK